MIIISGGQTGADRAALDFAIEHDIAHGGYCPKGRLSEDGVVPYKYKLIELNTPQYPPRTEKNVKSSDATLIIAPTKLSRGSKLTVNKAQKHNKPYLHIDPQLGLEQSSKQLADWLQEIRPEILNVAGSRESKLPGVSEFTHSVLTSALGYFKQ